MLNLGLVSLHPAPTMTPTRPTPRPSPARRIRCRPASSNIGPFRAGRSTATGRRPSTGACQISGIEAVGGLASRSPLTKLCRPGDRTMTSRINSWILCEFLFDQRGCSAGAKIGAAADQWVLAGDLQPPLFDACSGRQAVSGARGYDQGQEGSGHWDRNRYEIMCERQ